MTTRVTVSVPDTADYKVEIYFQKRGATIGGYSWDFDSLATLQPGATGEWHIHSDQRIATIEEVPL